MYENDEVLENEEILWKYTFWKNWDTLMAYTRDVGGGGSFFSLSCANFGAYSGGWGYHFSLCQEYALYMNDAILNNLANTMKYTFWRNWDTLFACTYNFRGVGIII